MIVLQIQAWSFLPASQASSSRPLLFYALLRPCFTPAEGKSLSGAGHQLQSLAFRDSPTCLFPSAAPQGRQAGPQAGPQAGWLIYSHNPAA